MYLLLTAAAVLAVPVAFVVLFVVMSWLERWMDRVPTSENATPDDPRNLEPDAGNTSTA
jgi:hypothetical protein